VASIGTYLKTCIELYGFSCNQSHQADMISRILDHLKTNWVLTFNGKQKGPLVGDNRSRICPHKDCDYLPLVWTRSKAAMQRANLTEAWTVRLEPFDVLLRKKWTSCTRSTRSRGRQSKFSHSACCVGRSGRLPKWLCSRSIAFLRA
jgi:hypothetical protein